MHVSKIARHVNGHYMKEYRTTEDNRAGGILALTCLALMLCTYAPQSQAKCALGKGLDKNVINIALGSILVPTNANATTGGTIARKTFPVSHDSNEIIRCDRTGGGSWVGTVDKGVPVPNTNRIYRTNIPGIGIRIGFQRRSSDQPKHFPFSTRVDANSAESSSAKNWVITVELYKLDKDTGNGSLDAGVYASMYSSDFPADALKVVVSGNATSIVTPSCTAAPTPTVQLGKVWKNLFSSVGSTAAEQSFDIKLNCREAKPELNAVYLRMDAKPDTSGAPGVIALSFDANAATGVGIQLLDKDRQPVTYGESALVGMSKDGVYSVPFHARYYQTASQVTAGVANGTATFTLEYK